MLPRPVATMGRAADGGQLLLATTAAPLGPEPIPANHFVQNTIHELSLHPWAIVSTHITDQRGFSQDEPGDTEHGVSPLGIAPLGDDWLVAFAGSNEVTQMTLASDMPRQAIAMDDFPLFAPHSAVDLGEGCWCVSSPSDGTIGLFAADDSEPKLIQLAATDEELQKLNPSALVQRRGEQTFYEAARAGISCQSCHLHADSDFSRQDIGGDMPFGVLVGARRRWNIAVLARRQQRPAARLASRGPRRLSRLPARRRLGPGRGAGRLHGEPASLRRHRPGRWKSPMS